MTTYLVGGEWAEGNDEYFWPDGYAVYYSSSSWNGGWWNSLKDDLVEYQSAEGAAKAPYDAGVGPAKFINTPVVPSAVPSVVQIAPESDTDMVNNPPHYNQSDIECIDAIKAALTPEEYRGYLKGCAMKYVWRERLKGGQQDIDKALWYLGKLS